MQDQQSHFINLVYDNKEVFSLHNEDLGYCNLIKHIIVTMTDKPVYLPLCTIPRQLQGEIHKCLRCLVVPGHYSTIQEPVHITGGYIVQEIRGNSSMHWLLLIKFHHGKRCVSITLNRWSPAGCPQQQLIYIIWPLSGVPPIGHVGWWHKENSF